MAKIIKGTLSVWKDKKGFGFIKPEDGGDDVFIHITALRTMSRRPYIGDIIFFQLEHEQDGRSKAVNAVIEGVETIDDGKAKGCLKWLLIVLLVVVVAVALVFGCDKFLNDSQISNQLFVLLNSL
jgi:cold shock CspA family protein